MAGGEKFTVRFVDGKTESVIVRALGVRDFEKYLNILDDEPAVAELLCDMPPKKVDRLDPASLGELVDFGEEVNAPFFQPWLARRMARKERMVTGLSSSRKAQKEASANSSPTSQSSAVEVDPS